MRRRSSFQRADLVGEIVAGDVRIAEHDDDVRDRISAEYGKRGIRWICAEAIGALFPHWDNFRGGHVSGDAFRSVGEADGYRINAMKGHGAILEADVFGVLDKEELHFLCRGVTDL